MSDPWKGSRGPEAVPHGTQGGYTNWRCRCALCRAANTKALREWRHAVARRRFEAGEYAVQPSGRPGTKPARV